MTNTEKARERYNTFHGTLFQSDLTMTHETMYECSKDVTATHAEKARIAKSMAVASIGLEIAAHQSIWRILLFPRTLHNLLKQKKALESF